MLKLLSIILSLYTISLALVPCSDAEHVESNGKVGIETTHNHENAGDCEDDACTPFCICSCCHTNVTVSEKIFIQHVDVIFYDNLIHDSYSDMESSPYFEPLFYPPIA